MPSRLLIWAVAIGVAGCEGDDERGELADAALGAGDAAPDASADATVGAGADAGAGPNDCASNEVALVTTLADGVADSQVVPIVVDGLDAWLALDTGAPFTFLFSDPAGPEYVEEAGTVQLGCEQWVVPGYREDAIGVELFEGLPILGILGLDFFLDGPATLDYPAGRLVRYLTVAPPAEDDELPAIPLHGQEHERALVDVVLDETDLTLMLDAGSHDTIWLGVEGDPDDDVTTVQTADGAQWQVWVGTGVLELPGEPPRDVPVLRALDIGYIQPELDEIGAQGLFGLTSLGWRRVVFDFGAGLLRLGPRVE